MANTIRKLTLEGIALILAVVAILVPFYFALINSFKSSAEAAAMQIDFPSRFHILDNFKIVIKEGRILQSFTNSVIISFFAISILIIISSMAAFVLQRRKGKASKIIDFFVLAGLIVPPAVVPTLWMLQRLHINNTLLSVILIQATLQFSFATIIYKSFYSSIPRELDEAAIVDGCSRFRMFASIIFPLLKPVTVTIMIITGINIFNDFMIPLYFLNGMKNTTIQLTIYYFFGKYNSDWNLVFADVILVSIPPLVFYLIFNGKIISGMTAGSVKG
ncbi:sugar ABC transporter permease [Paenibacillus baekrokdamisoli]|uniref:Sugar ABC transporter permease n=1 Tax=Paenibacillus baekrokdamisoli TaxID=1712516 RepID=A0A3G9JC98_9BACL|nr:carbohydrate ABC transporter permease [Paenibacillus baekrokdamisoli]MBB3071120.1 raffinose/stachyose/melibiose transport system permease protein [Paenibacillus baekrokdamisoli]BBH21538.1 sugar ABC transporter permease [Paenibacillus baekrokdamisoli]